MRRKTKKSRAKACSALAFRSGEIGCEFTFVKELIKEFRKQGDIIEKNIFRSVHNVNLRTIIGYHKDDMEYNFLDDYNERGK